MLIRQDSTSMEKQIYAAPTSMTHSIESEGPLCASLEQLKEDSEVYTW